MKQKIQYQRLNPGDIRQIGDEVRHKYGAFPGACVDPRDAHGEFRPVTLLGQPILESDLIVGEFRRPV